MNEKMCDVCGARPANVHLTQISHDQTVVSHLCEVCAGEKGISVSLAPDANLTGGSGPAENDIECPRCHLKQAEFRQTGRLGCQFCYEAFAQEVDDMLVQVHGSCLHKGKRYGKSPAVDAPAADVTALRSELQVAIESEEFELAASLRDRIHCLERSGGQGEGA
ncbi:MAG: hypothetical protein GF418_17490 [Chitinivibrionales bacterium]|nr:hypothetical protein [Chitinivibrionales bacterium]MBD3397415.1 hypothetical protein [Chitinivibrionales bacterium]